MDLRNLMLAQAGGKAIPNHPALQAGDPPITIGGPAKARLTQREAHRHLQAYGGTEAIDWVMDGVRLIAETASNAEYRFIRDGVDLVSDRGPLTPDEAENAPGDLVRLFARPNPHMDYVELIELLVIDLLLVGNAYWLKWRPLDDGRPLGLYRMAPPFIKVVPGDYGVTQYEYSVNNRDKPLVLSPEQVVHFKLPNPHSAYLGLGLIQGGGRPLDLELALTDTQATYYERHASPSAVVQSERRVPDNVFKKLTAQLRSMYSGTRNAGQLMVLESGLKYQSISPSAVDAGFESLTKLSRDRVFALLRVPKSLIIGGAGETGGRINDDQRVFDNKVMRPLLNRLQGTITRGVTDAWGIRYKVDHEYVMPVEERIRLTGEFGSIPGVRVWEVRKYAGLEPLGDENDQMVLNLPGDNGVEGDTRNGFPDRPLPREGGRPPDGQNTEAFPAPGGALPPGSRARRPSEKAMGIEDALARMALIEAKALPVLRPEANTGPLPARRPEDTLGDKRDADVDLLSADLHRALTDATYDLKQGLLDHVEGKAFTDRKRVKDANNLRKRVQNSESFRTFSASVSAAMEAAAKRALSSAVIAEGTAGRVTDEEIDYDAIARELVYRPDGANAIAGNLKSSVVDAISKALEGDADRPTLDRAVREQIDFWRTTQSETAALTETVHAYNEGTLVVAERTGHGSVLVSDGHDHDQPCRDADGQVWTIDYAREHRLEHPRCRRGFTPVGA